MEIKTISSLLSVSPQILPTDIVEIAKLGFKSIINNRPDKESDDQPLSTELAAEAARCGIQYQDMPIVVGELSPSDVGAFDAAMAELPGPVLAFCRSGTRSIMLWALNAAKRLDVDAILKTTDEAGFDLASMKTRLHDISNIDSKTL